MSDLIERFARGIHERYLAHETEDLGHPMGSQPGLAPWDELTEGMRDSNRGQATGFNAALEDCGLALAIETGDGEPFEFADVDVEYLARREHGRWSEQKRLQGYRYGPQRCDTPPDKRHPSLQPWSALTQDDRERDRNAIRSMPAVLRDAGLRVVQVSS